MLVPTSMHAHELHAHACEHMSFKLFLIFIIEGTVAGLLKKLENRTIAVWWEDPDEFKTIEKVVVNVFNKVFCVAHCILDLYIYLSNSKRLPCLHSLMQTRGRVGGNSRRLCKHETKSSVCMTVENSPNPPSCLHQAMQTR